MTHPSDPPPAPVASLPAPLRRHLVAGSLLWLLSTWPGGLLLNRIDPLVGPFPLYAVVWLLIVPVLAGAVHLWMWRAMAATDRAFMVELAADREVRS